MPHALPPSEAPKKRRELAEADCFADPQDDRKSQSSTSRPDNAREEPKSDFHDIYVLSHKLGKGAFAAVYLAHRIGSPNPVAVKVGDLRSREERAWDGYVDTKKANEAKKEVRLLEATCGMECVIHFIDAFHEGTLHYIVMERCDASLLQALERTPSLNEFSLREVFRGMLRGIAAVHACRIVHRDIKPDNYLCSGPKFEVRLCDFGLAATLPPPLLADNPDDPDPDVSLKGVYGTPPFMAPEMLRGEHYGARVDTWSFGVIVYVLFFGRFPYKPVEQTGTAMKAAIIAGAPGPTFTSKTSHAAAVVEETISEDGVEMVKELLCRNPRQRPSAAETLQHAFFTAPMDPDKPLPSLRPILYAARRAGAFDVRREKEFTRTEVDSRLALLQQKRHGPASAEGLLRPPAKGAGN